MAYKPYKMKGHSLPGPNQRKSPAKHPHTETKSHGTYGHNTDTGKSVAEGGVAKPDNPNYVPPKKESPAKTTHKAGHNGKVKKVETKDIRVGPGGKKGREVWRKETTRKDYAYQKRHAQLLNQGFTQKDADQMIKSGATTGKAAGKAAKTAYIKTIQNKKAKGGKLTKAEKRQLDEHRIHVTEQSK